MNHFRSYLSTAIGVLLLATLMLTTGYANAANIFQADFENHGIEIFDSNVSCCNHSVVVTNSQVRSGKRAVKFTLNSDDSGPINGKMLDRGERAELPIFGTAPVGKTRWYGLSLYIDPSWRDDTDDPNGTVVAQWHDNPDPGEPWRSPMLSFQVTKDNRWRIRNISDPNKITITNPNSFKKIDWLVGNVEKGKWTDWVVYVKWSYGSNGILKIWKDGKIVVNHNGPNTYNDEKPGFFKIGLYKSWWRHHLPAQRNTLIVYHDEIRIGDEKSSYEEIAPKGTIPVELPMPMNLRVVTER